jgi:hypothetical protein
MKIVAFLAACLWAIAAYPQSSGNSGPAYTPQNLNSLVVGSPTGANKGAGSINAQSIFVNGVAVGTGTGNVSSVGLNDTSTSPLYCTFTNSPITATGNCDRNDQHGGMYTSGESCVSRTNDRQCGATGFSLVGCGGSAVEHHEGIDRRLRRLDHDERDGGGDGDGTEFAGWVADSESWHDCGVSIDISFALHA